MAADYGIIIVMKTRALASKLKEFASSYPVVTITGPRQSGKTTIAKSCFPDYEYVNLESLNEREFAETDPVAFVDRFRNGNVILDEIQRVPSLLSQIQASVDGDRRKGRFILTGSHNLSLMRGVSQSLAGRTALATLLPFSLRELGADVRGMSMDEAMLKGFYPRIHDERLNPSEALSFYVDTYIERDVRQIENVRNLRSFRTFLRLAAGRTGQVLNVSSLAGDTGISPKVAGEWLSVLEASYIITLLPPWHANINKRLVKAPKLYFLDVGLACNLLGITEASQILAHPLRGALFETMIVGERLKSLKNSCSQSEMFYYRDSNRNEIDLVMPGPDGTRLCEIKSGATFSGDWTATMMRLAPQFGDVSAMSVVYGGDTTQKRTGFDLVSWRQA